MRTAQGLHQTTVLDVEGVRAQLKANQDPYSDEHGLNFNFELEDSVQAKVTNYKPSGIRQAAFSLLPDNPKALEDSFQSNKGTNEAFYGITSWMQGNQREEYTLSIPDDLHEQLKRQNTNVLYLYVKDVLGNTSVSTVFVGDYFLNMNIASKSSVFAVKNFGKGYLIAPVQNIYNYGKFKADVQVSLRGYQNSAGALQLVQDKASYGKDELALRIVPIQNTKFPATNVRNLENAMVDLGVMNPISKKVKDYHKAYSFEGDFSSNIDKQLKEISFVMQYHITPQIH